MVSKLCKIDSMIEQAEELELYINKWKGVIINQLLDTKEREIELNSLFVRNIRKIYLKICKILKKTLIIGILKSRRKKILIDEGKKKDWIIELKSIFDIENFEKSVKKKWN